MLSFYSWIEKINEMPISSIFYHGNPEDNFQRWSKRDTNLLTHPKYHKMNRVVKLWSNAKHKFELHFTNLKNKLWGYEDINLDVIKKQLGIDIQTKPDTISIVYQSNSSVVEPMTPWIMAHKIGHALIYNNIEYKQFADDIRNDFAEILKNVYDFDFKNKSLIRGDDFDSSNVIMALFNKVATMRSANKEKIFPEIEFVFEITAQYVLNNKITFNPLPSTLSAIQYGFSDFSITYLSDERKVLHANKNLDKYKNITEKLAHKYTEKLDQIFDNLKNTIVLF